MSRDYRSYNEDSSTFALPVLREQAGKMLADAFAHNYIEAEDYENRLSLIERAQRRGDVFSAVSDFPASMKDVYLKAVGDPEGQSEARRSSDYTVREESRVPSAPGDNLYSAVFSTVTIPYGQLTENRVSVSGIFGTVRLNLQTLPPGSEFHVFTRIVFGDLQIEVPPDTRIVRRCQTIFGELTVKSDVSGEEGPVLYIHGSAVFGEIKVRAARRAKQFGKMISDFFS